jgi:type I restriction enzyme M protein
LTSEEQKSADPRITKCLANASKQSAGNIGKPELLLHSPDAPGFIVVIECKADPAKHLSPDLTNPANIKDYAVDGALHYAKHLSTAFEAVAIAVSGETPATMEVSTYRRLKGASQAEELRNEGGVVTTPLGFADGDELPLGGVRGGPHREPDRWAH